MALCILAGLLCLVLPGQGAAQNSTPKPTTISKKKKSKKSKSKSKSKKKRGQQAIDSERALEIQQALIKQHYMQGEPTGHWDASTEAALRKFQGDQGWQTKTVPDSRALIKLGLGPSKDGLLNPESAMTTPPAGAQKTDPPNTKPQQ
jgi:peptidoglycan hydrolase-like protein with peptidoglycan-binding domain